jgi:hypothetical protein
MPALAAFFDRSGAERPVRDVPAAIRAALVVAVIAQIALAYLQPPPHGDAEAMPLPPGEGSLRVASLGDPVAFTQALTLSLQGFDDQPGVSIPFLELDYARVEAWLGRILALDPRGQYPLLLASQVYSQVPDPTRTRRMLDFVYRSYQSDPQRRWRWLAHAAIMAKHRLEDMELALTYAHALREHTQAGEIPNWARQMEIFFREDMGQYDAAKVLLGGMLDSGAVTDPHEQHFLIERLEQLEAAEKSSTPSKTRLAPNAVPAGAHPAEK